MKDATPRPWKTKPIFNATHPTNDVWIDDANGKPVLITDPDKAALIVRAVNSHDAMIEALEVAQEAINTWVATYASDMCGDKAVAEAETRIFKHGSTLGYTSYVAEKVNLALKIAKGEA